MPHALILGKLSFIGILLPKYILIYLIVIVKISVLESDDNNVTKMIIEIRYTKRQLRKLPNRYCYVEAIFVASFIPFTQRYCRNEQSR